MSKLMVILLFFVPLLSRGQMIVTVAGGGTSGLGDNGPGIGANFGGAIEGIAIDKKGNLYIADWWNNRVRKINSTTGIITTVAGTGVSGYNGENIAATTAQLYGPKFVAVDTQGNVYISETLNQRIRKIDTFGTISTYAGTGYGAGFTGISHSFTGDGGPATAANFDGPGGLALDSYGNLYVTDINNYRIRKIDFISHTINTIAGKGLCGYTGDNILATDACLVSVFDITTDIYDNIYLADHGTGCNRIRKINPNTHMIFSIAGTGISHYNGDSIEATMANIGPYSVTVDKAGNFMYITDYVNNRIRKVNLESGIISTFVGTGYAGFTGDYGAATNAEIFEPAHIVFDSCYNMYFADAQNMRVRKVVMDTACHFGLTNATDLEPNVTYDIYPNPAFSKLSINTTNIINKVEITNLLGQVVYFGKYSEKILDIDIGNLKAGLYFIKINEGYIRKFTKL